MASADTETILIVDDEEPVRRTFREWLEGANLSCHLLSASDAEQALNLADQNTIDLAILDWNLGTGSDGLKLLEDLTLFNPDIVAILVTGFAHQATPLEAMRMGVRDYLDKNQDLNRSTFLASVQRQLNRIRPARRERKFQQNLVTFRDQVQKVLPLVETAATLNDPVPLPAAIQHLFRFLQRTTDARTGVLIVRSFEEHHTPPETVRAYTMDGSVLSGPLVPFNRSLASSVASHQQPCILRDLEQTARQGGVELQSFERGSQALLAVPLDVAPSLQVVLELVDKVGPTGDVDSGGFTLADKSLVAAAAEFGAEMLRQSLADRQNSRGLLRALEAALGATEKLTTTFQDSTETPESPPTTDVLQGLRDGLGEISLGGMTSAQTVPLAEALRSLLIRHGPPAIGYCMRMVQQLQDLLDELTCPGESRS